MLMTMNGASIFNTPARSNIGHNGIADIIMNDTSKWNNNGVIYVGNNAGADGYLELNDSSELDMSGNLNVGIAATGVIQLNGGLISAPNLELGSFGEIDIVDGAIELDYYSNPENPNPESWAAYKARITGYDVTTGNGTGDATFLIDETNTVITIVPEPATFALFGAGLALLRRKK